MFAMNALLNGFPIGGTQLEVVVMSWSPYYYFSLYPSYDIMVT